MWVFDLKSEKCVRSRFWWWFFCYPPDRSISTARAATLWCWLEWLDAVSWLHCTNAWFLIWGRSASLLDIHSRVIEPLTTKMDSWIHWKHFKHHNVQLPSPFEPLQDRIPPCSIPHVLATARNCIHHTVASLRCFFRDYWTGNWATGVPLSSLLHLWSNQSPLCRCWKSYTLSIPTLAHPRHYFGATITHDLNTLR